MATVIAGGWTPPGCGGDEHIEVPLLSDLVDVNDPAFPDIMQVVLELRSLELELTEELMAIEPGGYDLEQERHRQFCRLRSHGEWFRLEDPLTGHIEQLQGDGASS